MAGEMNSPSGGKVMNWRHNSSTIDMTQLICQLKYLMSMSKIFYFYFLLDILLSI